MSTNREFEGRVSDEIAMGMIVAQLGTLDGEDGQAYEDTRVVFDALPPESRWELAESLAGLAAAFAMAAAQHQGLEVREYVRGVAELIAASVSSNGGRQT